VPSGKWIKTILQNLSTLRIMISLSLREDCSQGQMAEQVFRLKHRSWLGGMVSRGQEKLLPFQRVWQVKKQKNYLQPTNRVLPHYPECMCRALLLDSASDLLLSLALRLGTVYHRNWDVLLWTLPLGIVWRRSCFLELMEFLLSFSSGVLRRGLEGAVRPFGWRLGWRRCTASQLIYSHHVF